jgi:DNA polymerase-1
MLVIDQLIAAVTEVTVSEHDVARINSIEVHYKPKRQDSKAPTFALTYQGTWSTLVKNCGFSPQVAKEIEQRYHGLYAVSTEWVQKKLNQAAKEGYITGAFGLRLRTPLLAQVVRGNRQTPREAEAEGRTAGNALGQSWCLLNSRAWAATMKIVRASPYRTTIRPCAQIHDAGYALVRDDIEPIMFLNEHLVREVQWNNHPDIYHPEVGLGGELSIFYPTWKDEIGIPNGATEDEIFTIVKKVFS